MTLILKDRVKETTTTVGLGTISLGGSSDTFEPFSTIGTGNTTYYAIVAEGNDNWEVGVGTVGSGTLSRDIVLASSNLNAKVNFPAGTKDVFVTLPANKIVSKDDATGINSGISLADYVDFDTTAAPATSVGRLFWNDQDGTLDLGLKGGSVTIHIGQKQVIRIVNKIGSSLSAADYQCVKISGAQGQRPKVALAQANNDANSADTIGLVNETIANNQEGFVCTGGTITNINTTGSLQGESWNDGDVLYLSGTVAGRITNVRPQAPIHTVIVGFVIYAHANQGKIFVKVDNGYELDELHNVRINGVTNGQVLTYNNGLWENQTNGSGTVTSVSVVSANGLSGSVANSTTTPAITLSTSVSGLLKGSSGALAAASATDVPELPQSKITNLVSDLAAKAPLASPALTGTPTAPTAAVGTNTTQVATTEFVNAEIANDAPSKTGTGASGTWGISVTGNAGTVTNGVYTTGNQTIVGTKTFSSDVILSGIAANSVLYLTASKYVTGGGTLVFNGSQLGINVSSPSYSLDVAGTFNIASNGSSNTATINHTSGSGIALNISKGGNNEAIYVNKTSGSGNAVTVVGTVQATSFVGALTGNASTVTNGVYTTGDQTIAGIKTFSGASTIVNGNLGVGVTPSAWSAIKSIQVGTGASFSGGSGFNDAFIASNAYYDGTNWRYLNSNTAHYSSIGGTASARWYTAPSGTAGNAISFTQAMTLDASGRLLLGTTTGVGNDFTSIRFNSAGSFSQGLNMVDSNASASGTVFQVFRKSDDTYLGNIRRNSTDNALYVGGNSYLALGSGDTERMRLDSAGNVGIGTSSPVGRLTIQGAAGTNGINQGIGLLYSNGTQFGALGLNNSSGWPQLMARAGAGMTFHVNSDLLTTGEAMRIDSSGNVGIGTTSPTSARLVVISPANSPSLLLTDNTQSTLTVKHETGNLLTYEVNGTATQRWVGNGSERMRIDGGGKVLIGAGATASLGDLVVSKASSGTAVIALESQGSWNSQISSTSTGNMIFSNGTNERMRINASGDVGIGTSSPSQKLEVGGSILASGNVTAYSDIRVKDNVESIEGAIGKLNQIRGVTYTRTDLDDKQRRFAGVIAQEIEQVLPEAVFDNGKVKAVDYNATIALLIEAVKEQQKRIDKLETLLNKGN